MANKGAFKKGQKKRNQGKRGPNKLTKSVKDAFQHVFNDLQKDPEQAYALGKWAKEQPVEFYKLAAKLIPQDIKANVTATVKTPGLEVVAAALGLKK